MLERFLKNIPVYAADRAFAVLLAAVIVLLPLVAVAEVDYRPAFTGVDDKKLLKELRENSYLFQFQKNKPLSVEGLDRRAADDVQRLRDVMIGHAFYGADIRYKLSGDVEPLDVTVSVDTGPLFQIADYDLVWQTKKGKQVKPPAKLAFDDILKKTINEAATPAAILDAERIILDRLKENGYPLPNVAARNVTVDHATQKARVSLVLEAGTPSVFGKTETKGHENVDADFVHRRIGFKPGDLYSIAKVVSTRQALLKTGLFSTVDVLLAAKDGKSQVPVTIQMVERKPRTIGAGLSYSTSQSVSTRVFWEHRNLRGGAEKIHVEAEAGINRYGLNTVFTKPDFGGNKKRSLQIKAGARQEFLEGYDKTSYTTSAGLSQSFGDHWSASFGGGLEFSQIKEKNKAEDDFLLLSFPAALKYDSTEDALDPVQGLRATLGATPYLTVNEADSSFFVTEFSGSHYLPLQKENKVVFANRIKLGAIWGQGTTTLPADKRLYSGGGGSVRGYGYQLVGPLDANDDPTGGRYQIEVGSEMRFRVTDDIGLATFVEGGRVSEDIGGGGDFLWAAGIGGRYYTSVGPVRVDVAVPLNGRSKDDAFQVYFSLGQAF